MGNDTIIFKGGYSWGTSESLFVFDNLAREFKSSNPDVSVNERPVADGYFDSGVPRPTIMYPSSDDFDKFVSYARNKNIYIILQYSRPDIKNIWWPQEVSISYKEHNEYVVWLKMVYL